MGWVLRSELTLPVGHHRQLRTENRVVGLNLGVLKDPNTREIGSSCIPNWRENARKLSTINAAVLKYNYLPQTSQTSHPLSNNNSISSAHNRNTYGSVKCQWSSRDNCIGGKSFSAEVL